MSQETLPRMSSRFLFLLKRREFLGFLVFLTLITSLFFSQVTVQAEEPSLSLPPFAPKTSYELVFVGYDPGFIDEAAIRAYLPSNDPNGYRGYDFEYEFIYPDETYVQGLNNFIDEIKVLDWTSKLNETALLEQKENFGRKDIFTTRMGYAIDAKQVEQYLANHLPSTSLPDTHKQYIFLLNQSRLDTDTYDHWYNVTEIDPDAGRSRFFWRLEWDYPLNFDVKFPYAAFTSETEIAYLDPTAFQWYLKWREIWNINVDTHASYGEDLDHLIQGKTPTEQKQIISDTLGYWLRDWVGRYFSMPRLNDVPGLNTSVSMQLYVYYDSRDGMTENDMTWIINETHVKNVYRHVLGTNDIDVQVMYRDISTDGIIFRALNNTLIDYQKTYDTPPPFDDWKYYDGFSLYNALYYGYPDYPAGYDPANYFNETAADTVLEGFMFVLDNASFSNGGVPWAGHLFTGLGGGGRLTILWELDRAFMPDHQTPKSGLGRVLVHEAGHAVGFPHTFDDLNDRFTSDFALDVMGYYPGVANFSLNYLEQFWKLNLDKKINELNELYNTKANKYSSSGGEDLKNALLEVETIYDYVINLHNARDYLSAYSYVLLSIDILENEQAAPVTFSTTSIITTSTTTSISDKSRTTTDLETTSSSLPVWSFVTLLSLMTAVVIIKKRSSH